MSEGMRTARPDPQYDGVTPYSTLAQRDTYWLGIISEFRGDHAFLSNFYESPFDCGGRIVPTAEHAYQAQKAAGQPSIQALILGASTPGHSKYLGGRAKLRPGWDALRVEVMRRVFSFKFPQAVAGSGEGLPELSRKLLETGGYHLIEGNVWGDTFWGCVHPTPGSNLWVGSNMLGILLMERRAELQRTIPF